MMVRLCPLSFPAILASRSEGHPDLWRGFSEDVRLRFANLTHGARTGTQSCAYTKGKERVVLDSNERWLVQGAVGVMIERGTQTNEFLNLKKLFIYSWL